MATPTRLLCSLDSGTQSTRAVLYDSVTLRVVASHQQSLTQHLPQPGWVEHEPQEIEDCARACLDSAVATARAALGEVCVLGLGLTNQRETTVLWCRRSGKPLCRAIVWLDTRTAELCSRLAAQFGGADAFRRTTGLPIGTYFSAYKLLWALENVPAVAAAAAEGRLAFGTVDSWLLYRLTGGSVHVTDVTNASRTGLLDLRTRRWHEPTLCALGIPAHALPALCSSAEVYGHVAGGALHSVPICGCLGDQQAALLGQRCRTGEAKCTFGTGAFLLLNTGQALVHSSHGLLTTLAFQLGPSEPAAYALEGSIAIAGAGVSWLRDNLGIIAEASEIEALAESVPDSAGLVFVPAFGGLFAPHWRDDARGIVCGLTQFSTRAHLARALLEAICLQTADVSDAMRSDVLRARLQLSQSELRVDGGASSNSLLLRVLADTLGLRVLRPENNETTSLGAALAAGVALELWSASDVFTMPIYGGVAEFVPSLGQGEREARRRRWASAVSRCLAWTRVPPPLLLETGRRASTVVPCLLFGAIAGAALARWWPRFK